MRKTKKAFEEHLNKVHGVTHERWGNGRYGALKRPYGTYLRNQDPEKFNIEYDDWLDSHANNDTDDTSTT